MLMIRLCEWGGAARLRQRHISRFRDQRASSGGVIAGIGVELVGLDARLVGDRRRAYAKAREQVCRNLTVMVNEMLAPFAMFPMLQVRGAPVHGIVLVKNVVPAGSVSVTTTLVALDGPLLVTLREYVSCAPATTELGAVFVMARSAGLHVGSEPPRHGFAGPRLTYSVVYQNVHPSAGSTRIML